MWQANPQKGLNFPYTGEPAKASIGLRKLIPDMDVRPFAAEVQEVLVHTRAALSDFAPTVRAYDDAIRALIDRAVRSWQ